MRVRVISFGTNWWVACSHDLSDPICFRRRAAWFNSAGLKQGRVYVSAGCFPVRFASIAPADSTRSFLCAPLASHFTALGQTFCADGRIFCFTLQPKMPYLIGSWSQSMSE